VTGCSHGVLRAGETGTDRWAPLGTVHFLIYSIIFQMDLNLNWSKDGLLVLDFFSNKIHNCGELNKGLLYSLGLL
jgi:hypothetical protein